MQGESKRSYLRPRGRRGRKGPLITKQPTKLAHYQITAQLGRGAQGHVYRAFDTQHGRAVAIKCIPNTSVETVRKEIRLLKSVSGHENVVSYLDLVETTEHLGIVMELVDQGSLTSLFSTFPEGLTESLAQGYMRQVLKALEFLHERGIVHRDIKAANILLTSSGNIKLADFGVSTETSLTSEEKNTTLSADVVGTPYWMAPEVIEMVSKPSSASDIWSAGCLCVELLTKRPPYYELSRMQAIFRIVDDSCPPIPQSGGGAPLSQACLDFMKSCFRKNPEERSSAADLLQHDWMTQGIHQKSSKLSSVFSGGDEKTEGGSRDGDNRSKMVSDPEGNVSRLDISTVDSNLRKEFSEVIGVFDRAALARGDVNLDDVLEACGWIQDALESDEDRTDVLRLMCRIGLYPLVSCLGFVKSSSKCLDAMLQLLCVICELDPLCLEQVLMYNFIGLTCKDLSLSTLRAWSTLSKSHSRFLKALLIGNGLSAVISTIMTCSVHSAELGYSLQIMRQLFSIRSACPHGDFSMLLCQSGKSSFISRLLWILLCCVVCMQSSSDDEKHEEWTEPETWAFGRILGKVDDPSTMLPTTTPRIATRHQGSNVPLLSPVNQEHDLNYAANGSLICELLVLLSQAGGAVRADFCAPTSVLLLSLAVKASCVPNHDVLASWRVKLLRVLHFICSGGSHEVRLALGEQASVVASICDIALRSQYSSTRLALRLLHQQQTRTDGVREKMSSIYVTVESSATSKLEFTLEERRLAVLSLYGLCRLDAHNAAICRSKGLAPRLCDVLHANANLRAHGLPLLWKLVVVDANASVLRFCLIDLVGKPDHDLRVLQVASAAKPNELSECLNDCFPALVARFQRLSSGCCALCDRRSMLLYRLLKAFPAIALLCAADETIWKYVSSILQLAAGETKQTHDHSKGEQMSAFHNAVNIALAMVKQVWIQQNSQAVKVSKACIAAMDKSNVLNYLLAIPSEKAEKQIDTIHQVYKLLTEGTKI